MSWLECQPVTLEVVGSSLIRIAKIYNIAEVFNISVIYIHGGYSQVVKTTDCDSIMHKFESHYPPQRKLNTLLLMMGYSQVVRQRILIPSCAGSNPATLAKYTGCENFTSGNKTLNLRGSGDIAKW